MGWEVLIWSAYGQVLYRSKPANKLCVFFLPMFSRKCQKHLELWCCFPFHNYSLYMIIYVILIISRMLPTHLVFVGTETAIALRFSLGQSSPGFIVIGRDRLHLYKKTVRGFSCTYCFSCIFYPRSERLRDFLVAHLIQYHNCISQSWLKSWYCC